MKPLLSLFQWCEAQCLGFTTCFYATANFYYISLIYYSTRYNFSGLFEHWSDYINADVSGHFLYLAIVVLGKLVRRQRLPKNDVGDFWSWKDLNIAMNLPCYGWVFRIYDCDRWTRVCMMFVWEQHNRVGIDVTFFVVVHVALAHLSENSDSSYLFHVLTNLFCSTYLVVLL